MITSKLILKYKSWEGGNTCFWFLNKSVSVSNPLLIPLLHKIYKVKKRKRVDATFNYQSDKLEDTKMGNGKRKGKERTHRMNRKYLSVGLRTTQHPHASRDGALAPTSSTWLSLYFKTFFLFFLFFSGPTVLKSPAGRSGMGVCKAVSC